MLRIILAAVAVMLAFFTTAHAEGAKKLTFAHYPAKVVPVKFNHAMGVYTIPNTVSAKFANEIRAHMTGIPNFAGHYEIVVLSSGTAQFGAVVDLLNGKTVDLPSLAVRWDFRLNSTLFISGLLDPADPDYVPQWLMTKYYVWTGAAFNEIYEEKPVADAGPTIDESIVTAAKN